LSLQANLLLFQAIGGLSRRAAAVGLPGRFFR
jgi:hypothetical protein